MMPARAGVWKNTVPAFKSARENLRSIYILLFLTIAFFFLEHQDADKYARLFSFHWEGFASGELWRLFSYQFTQAGQGWFSFPRPVVLFFTLLLLYVMGNALEEEWGTFHFLALFTISTGVSALAASVLGIALLGSFFVNFTLLFVYALAYPGQTFYLFGVVPVRISWIAIAAAVVLVMGVVAGGGSNIAALAGAGAAVLYFLALRKAPSLAVSSPPAPAASTAGFASPDGEAIRNAARFVAVKRAVATGSAAEIDRLIAQFDREVVRGVNICPPADYKPENADGYCIRCEGFAECSSRYLSMAKASTMQERTFAKPERSEGSPEPLASN